MPNRTLLGWLVATIAYLPLVVQAAGATTVHDRRSSGVVMMVGGMASQGDPTAAPSRAASEDSHASPDDAGRQSVVTQPGSSVLNDAVRQTSASVASRVMALLPIINEAAHVADVDSALLMAVIDVESGGNPQAVSPKGATGLMQLMPGTGARHGASDLLDPRQNIAAGARYLKELMRQFGALPLALAAYNAGEGAVQKYGGQIPPYTETMNYVPKVIARYRWYQDASSSAGIASVQAASSNVRGRFLLVGSGGAD
ncbi:lytic transglycosylase domain-containing protein [Paraburkholderia phytofirmans]|uniref:lytic transglycosylase domain-containing protein n=1 Tax=Paraburkholderia phytofirmans TaxID=261302 RepID=UPI0038B716E6